MNLSLLQSYTFLTLDATIMLKAKTANFFFGSVSKPPKRSSRLGGRVGYVGLVHDCANTQGYF